MTELLPNSFEEGDFEMMKEIESWLADLNLAREAAGEPLVEIDLRSRGRFTRIFYRWGDGRQAVFCFVDKDGEIVPSSGWKTPAKVRYRHGNIHDASGRQCIGDDGLLKVTSRRGGLKDREPLRFAAPEGVETIEEYLHWFRRQDNTRTVVRDVAYGHQPAGLPEGLPFDAVKTLVANPPNFWIYCSSSGARWFWIITPSSSNGGPFNERRADLDIVHDGFAESKEAAIDAAMSAVSEDAIYEGRSFAGCVLRDRAVERRSTQTANTTETRDNEYLYTVFGSDETKHRVVKKTAKYIFVESQVYGNAVHCKRLSREQLESTGEACSCQRTFYTRDAMDRRIEKMERQRRQFTSGPDNGTPSCLSLLGLSRDASHTDIAREFRKRAITAHPDQGGSATEFKRLHDAFQQSLAIVSS